MLAIVSLWCVASTDLGLARVTLVCGHANLIEEAV